MDDILGFRETNLALRYLLQKVNLALRYLRDFALVLVLFNDRASFTESVDVLTLLKD